MIRNNKSHSTPSPAGGTRRSARLSKKKAATSTPFATPPVRSTASSSKSTGQRPPLVPKTRSNKKRGTPTPPPPSLASSSKKPRTNAPSPDQSPAGHLRASSNSPTTEHGQRTHKPREMEVNKQTRAAIMTGNTQKWLKATTIAGKTTKVNLQLYQPSKAPFLGMPIEYCIDYHGKHSVPPDLPNRNGRLKQHCLNRVPASYLEHNSISPLSMKEMLYQHLRDTFAMTRKEMITVIESISGADLIAAAATRADAAVTTVPTVAVPSASLAAVPAPASPSIGEMMKVLDASTVAIASLSQSSNAAISANQSAISANQSAIASLTENQVASNVAISANQSAIANLAQGQAANQSAIANLAQGQAANQSAIENLAQGQVANQSAIANLAQGQAGLSQRTAQLEESSTEIRHEISNLKEAITQSAQKQFNEVASKASASAALSMGGMRLFCDSPSSSPMASPLRPVPENDARTNEPLELEDISKLHKNHFIKRCYELVADSSSLLAEHQSNFQEWHTDTFGKGQRIESADVLKVPVYAVENVSDLENLESVEELFNALDRNDAIAKLGPSTFVMAVFSDLYETNPFITTQILPALHGCKIEFLVTCGDCDVSIIAPSPEEAKDALWAVLRLASRTNANVDIQPDNLNPNRRGGKHPLCLPEVQMKPPEMQMKQPTLKKLELLSCKLCESAAVALSSLTSNLSLVQTEVEAGCASRLFKAVENGNCTLKTIAIGEGTSIPSDELLGHMQSNNLWNLSLKRGAWNELPPDVLAEFKKKIVDAIATGSNLGFTMHHEDILTGPLKAAADGLVRTLSANHPSIQKICQHGALGLPFKVDQIKSKFDDRVKEWAQNLFPDQA